MANTRVVKYELTKDLRVLSYNEKGEVRELVQSIDSRGYLRVCIMIEGKRKNKYIHRWVAEEFVPNPKPGIYDCVDHIDMNKLNNSPENLRWCTKEQNTKWAQSTVMNDEVAAKATDLLLEGLSGSEVSRRLNVSRFTLSSWKRKNFKKSDNKLGYVK